MEAQGRAAGFASGTAKELTAIRIFCNPIVDSHSALLLKGHVIKRWVADFVDLKFKASCHIILSKLVSRAVKR
jgi:hypothetical protein